MAVTITSLNTPWPLTHTTIGGPEKYQVDEGGASINQGGILFVATALLTFIGATNPVVGDGVSTKQIATNLTFVGGHIFTFSNPQITGLTGNTNYSIRAFCRTTADGVYHYGPTVHVTTTPYAHVAPTCNLFGGVTNVSYTPGNPGLTCLLHGQVTDTGSGGDPSTHITARGYVLSISPDPTVPGHNVQVNDSVLTGTNISALNPGYLFVNLPWYYRAYATNDAGLTGYSAAFAAGGTTQGPFGIFTASGSQVAETDAAAAGTQFYQPPMPPVVGAQIVESDNAAPGLKIITGPTTGLAIIQTDLRAWLSSNQGAALGNRALHRATSQRDHEPRQRQSDLQLAIGNFLIRDTGGDGIVGAPPLPPDGPTFWHDAPNDGKVGVPYSYTWAALGTPLPTLAMTGSIPPGLTFTPGAGGNGVLAGTPTSTDTDDHSFTVTVTATNDTGTATITNTIVIKGKPVVTPTGTSPLLGWNGDAGEFPTIESGLGFAFKGGWEFISGTVVNEELEAVLTAWDGDTTHDLLWPLGMLPNGITMAEGAAGSTAITNHWKDVAQKFLNHSRPTAIARFGWEFNQPNHFAWAFDKNPGGYADYVKCYRRIVDALRSVAPNIRTIYNPGMGQWGITGTGAQWYPGDDYITYVGLDFYDQIFPSYPASNATAWNYYLSGNVTGRTAGWGLNWLKSFASPTSHNKPILIPEVGPGFSSNAGQNGGDDGFTYLMSHLQDWATTAGAYMVIAAVGGPTARANFHTKFPQSWAELKADWS